MRTDREAQGRQRDPGKDKGPWGGKFLCNLGKTRALGVGNSYAILGNDEDWIK